MAETISMEFTPEELSDLACICRVSEMYQSKAVREHESNKDFGMAEKAKKFMKISETYCERFFKSNPRNE